MDRAEAYAALTEEVGRWRHLSFDDLTCLVGDPPSVKSVILGGEVIEVEIRIRWAETKHDTIRVEAVAYGPSCWRLDRLEESFIVAASQLPGKADA